jgi:hypothetical protein
MCVEGRFSPIHEGWQSGGPDIEPGDFVELSVDSPITHLYGSGRTNILVGVCSPEAGGIDVVNLAS